MSTEELTGRRRFREVCPKLWVASILILQVEVSVFETVNENKPGRWVCCWRDATVNDVQQGELV